MGFEEDIRGARLATRAGNLDEAYRLLDGWIVDERSTSEQRYRAMMYRATAHQKAGRLVDEAMDIASAHALPERSAGERYVAATAAARNAQKRGATRDAVTWLRMALVHAMGEPAFQAQGDAHTFLTLASEADITDEDRRMSAVLIRRVRGEQFAVALDTRSLVAALALILDEERAALDLEYPPIH